MLSRPPPAAPTQTASTQTLRRGSGAGRACAEGGRGVSDPLSSVRHAGHSPVLIDPPLESLSPVEPAQLSPATGALLPPVDGGTAAAAGIGGGAIKRRLWRRGVARPGNGSAFRNQPSTSPPPPPPPPPPPLPPSPAAATLHPGPAHGDTHPPTPPTPLPAGAGAPPRLAEGRLAGAAATARRRGVRRSSRAWTDGEVAVRSGAAGQ